jgi:hypothetical protein
MSASAFPTLSETYQSRDFPPDQSRRTPTLVIAYQLEEGGELRGGVAFFIKKLEQRANYHEAAACLEAALTT